jgi:hypothetical protein
MKVARLGATAAAVLAMSGALAYAQTGNSVGDPLRQRAEELAQAASERFDDFERPQRVAQAEGWIEHAGREYRHLMQRLAQVQEPAKKPATTPTEKATAPAEKKAPPSNTAAEKSGQSGKGHG